MILQLRIWNTLDFQEIPKKPNSLFIWFYNWQSVNMFKMQASVLDKEECEGGGDVLGCPSKAAMPLYVSYLRAVNVGRGPTTLYSLPP